MVQSRDSSLPGSLKRQFDAGRKAIQASKGAVQPTVGVGVAGYSVTSFLSGAPLPSIWTLLVIGLACSIPATVEKIAQFWLGGMLIKRYSEDSQRSDAKDYIAMFRELSKRSGDD
ncbi:hypothetical protein ACIG5D_11720 [Microbispora rosea]|uniref:hypothetical protein n=1 Tax=Microbispora rosea TaxID=58117 RepID=UPI0037C896EB